MVAVVVMGALVLAALIIWFIERHLAAGKLST
jgi:hypothetical protein